MISINGYKLDAALSESLAFESEASDIPIEKGANITDHIRPKEPVLEFEGLVSDTPIGVIATDPTRTGLDGSTLPSRDAFQRFEALHKAAEPVVVECSYGRFENMALVSLTPKRSDNKDAKAFRFTAQFKRIKFVTNNRTTVRMSIPCGGPKTKLGAADGKRSLGQVTYVIVFPVAKRAQFTKGYGAPVATGFTSVVGNSGLVIPRAPFDCYAVMPGRERNADGFLEKNTTNNPPGRPYIYHEFATLYDPGTQTRKDLEGHSVTEGPTPKFVEQPSGGWWDPYVKNVANQAGGGK